MKNERYGKMKNLTIKTRLIGGFCIPILLTTLNVAFGMMSMHRIAQAEAHEQEAAITGSMIFSIAALILSRNPWCCFPMLQRILQ